MGNNDYTDTVVLVEKPDLAETAVDIDIDVAVKCNTPDVNKIRLTRIGDVEINALTIDETLEGGGDPYNSTGKHCVVKIKQ